MHYIRCALASNYSGTSLWRTLWIKGTWGHCLLSQWGHCLLSQWGHCLLSQWGHCLLSQPTSCFLFLILFVFTIIWFLTVTLWSQGIVMAREGQYHPALLAFVCEVSYILSYDAIIHDTLWHHMDLGQHDTVWHCMTSHDADGIHCSPCSYMLSSYLNKPWHHLTPHAL